MDRKFAEKWLSKLKEYWIYKDIEKAVSLFSKTNKTWDRKLEKNT